MFVFFPQYRINLLQDVDLFVTVDLYEAKNMLQVQHCLDKLRIRFGGEKVGLARAGSDVFDSPTLGSGAPSPVAATPAASAPAATGAPKFCPECGAGNSGG